MTTDYHVSTVYVHMFVDYGELWEIVRSPPPLNAV